MAGMTFMKVLVSIVAVAVGAIGSYWVINGITDSKTPGGTPTECVVDGINTQGDADTQFEIGKK